MGKPFRSPLVGYNHNLSHLGRVFHVQSEDSGVAAPRLFTHLFFGGTILASRKHEYDPAEPDDRVRTLMQGQHKLMIRDLIQGKLDERIIAFFAARGEDIAPVVPGAVPAAPLLETAAPVMVLPTGEAPAVQASGPVASVSPPPRETEPAAPAAELAGEPAEPPPLAPAVPVAPPREGSGAVSGRVGPRRTSTRPIETGRRGGGNPAPVVVRAPTEGRRPPFVRSGSGPVAKLASADGVVVQRSVVVGEGGSGPARPARIRPPVPYVVTGGGHTERPTRAEPAPAAPPAAPTSTAAAPPPAPAALVAEGARATTGGFGVGLADDKSLDEVILEYLSDDGE